MSCRTVMLAISEMIRSQWTSQSSRIGRRWAGAAAGSPVSESPTNRSFSHSIANANGTKRCRCWASDVAVTRTQKQVEMTSQWNPTLPNWSSCRATALSRWTFLSADRFNPKAHRRPPSLPRRRTRPKDVVPVPWIPSTPLRTRSRNLFHARILRPLKASDPPTAPSPAAPKSPTQRPPTLHRRL